MAADEKAAPPSDYKLLIIHATLNFSTGTNTWNMTESSNIAIFKNEAEVAAALAKIDAQNEFYKTRTNTFQSRGVDRLEYMEAMKLY